MGYWGPGPFDNDGAADFATDLDAMSADERPRLIREALQKLIDEADLAVEEYQRAQPQVRLYASNDRLDHAFAAAWIVAAQRAGIAPLWYYGPQNPIPPLPPTFDALAVKVLNILIDDWEGEERGAKEALAAIYHSADS